MAESVESAGMNWKHRLLEPEGILTPSRFD